MDTFQQQQSLRIVSYFNAELSVLPIRPYIIPDGLEVVELITGGTVFFEAEGKMQPFSRGTIFWHIAGDSTIWDTPANAPYKCAVFQFFTSRKHRSAPRRFRWRGSDRGLEDFIGFSRSWYAEKPDDPGLLFYCLSQLYAHANAPERAVCTQTAADQLPGNSRLLQAAEYLEQHINAPPDIDKLCEVSGLGRNRLFREFNQYFKCSPHVFILQQRISKAEKLLESTALPIKEIAGLCGFDNIEVFYRVFKKYNGSTPGAFRKACASYALIH